MAVHGIIGKKVGMTQIFTADGTVVPVTVVQAGPCLVVQKKTADKDGYDALQIGLVGLASGPPRQQGGARAASRRPAWPRCARCMEVRADKGDELEARRQGPLRHVRRAGARRRHRHVQGQGLHGRRGAARLRAAARRRTAPCSTARPGSIGASAFPSRVYPGTRSSGRLGGRQSTTKNLVVVRVDLENNLLYISGAVPGARNSIVKIVRSSFAKKA